MSIEFLNDTEATETIHAAQVETLQAQGMPPEKAQDMIENAKPETPEEILRREARAFIESELVRADVLFQSEPPDRDPVIEKHFDAGALVAILAPSKCRKSFFALQLAACIASGHDFIGLKIHKPRRVLLVQFEVTGADVHRRLKMMERGFRGKPNTEDRLLIFNARGHEFDLSRFAYVIRESRAEVVIFDPLYSMQEGGENGAEDMKPIFKSFLQICKDSGAAVAYVHHDAKGNAAARSTRDRGSGSGVIGRAYDAAFCLAEHEEENHFICETLFRSYPPREAFSMIWEDGIFQPSSRAPIAKKPASPTANPTTRHPDESFFPILQEILQEESELSSGDLDKALREQAGVTKEKAVAVRLAAIRDGILTVRKDFQKGKLHSLPVETPNPTGKKEAQK
jgi:hypothetical protein